MINLLPPQQKQLLMEEKKRKLASVLGNTVVISLVSLILVLFALKFYLLAYASYQKETLESSVKKQDAEVVAFRELVTNANRDLIRVNNFYKKTLSFSDALLVISQLSRPAGLYLTSITLAELEGGQGLKATVAGMSETRDDLLIFKETLEQNPVISNAYFPPEDWIKPKKVNFYVTFEMKDYE